MSLDNDATTVEQSPPPEDQHNNDKGTTNETEEEDTKPTQPIKDNDSIEHSDMPMPIPTIVINNSEGGNVEPPPDSPTSPEQVTPVQDIDEDDQYTREEPIIHDEPDEIAVEEVQHVEMDVKEKLQEQQQQDDSNTEHVEQSQQETTNHRHDKEETKPISSSADINTDVAIVDEAVTTEHKPSQQPPSPPVEPENPDIEQPSSPIATKDNELPTSSSSLIESEPIEKEPSLSHENIIQEQSLASHEPEATTGLGIAQQEDDDETPLYQRRIQSPSPSVVDFYAGKTVLLTGSTGFVGKAVLWKLIQSLGSSIGKIYLLIRSGSNKRSKIGRPADRIKNEILNNKAFLDLRSDMGEAVFDEIIQKVQPITGDIISPDLSLSDQDREMITNSVQVFIHCAATLDYHERLDLALETNTLGTLRLMDLADECVKMESFVHMSIAYFNPNMPDGYIQERVYPMEIGDPEELLKEIVGLELQDIPKMTQRIMQAFPNTYTFTKFLTEHLILKRVDYNRVEEAQGGKKQWPIAIVRATQVGAGAYEPLPGWVDGITGTNGSIFLLGHGIQVLQTDIGHMPADIIPVDYLARVALSSAAMIQAPGTRFLLPYNEIITEDDGLNSPLPQPIIPCFPIIYQVSASSLRMATWSEIYDGVCHYWTRNTKVSLPTSKEYFVTNKALLKARIFVKNHLANSIVSMTTAINANNNNNNDRSYYSKVTARTIESASRNTEANQPFLRHRWVFDHQNVRAITDQVANDAQFNLAQYQHIDWFSYMVNYSYGTHTYIAQSPPGLRNLVVPDEWDCALYSKQIDIRHSIIEKPIESVVFSASDIQKRTERMLLQLVETLENTQNYDQRDKRKNEEWINDFDASLDDWCHDDSGVLKDAKTAALLGRWGKVLGEHDEAIKVVVLNDKRVRNSVEQIIETSGVPQQTVVGEAIKILLRMRERTQLAYVWFAGAFLDGLFKRLFSTIRVSEADLAKLKDQIKNKNVVYVPVSKTLLDQLLIWYVCLRYHLPMPAIICDEALALLGPISDILRIAGAYFVRRDQNTRSPLNTAVTAAYTEALLHEHGALSMLIEKTRSRTGRLHTAYADGMIDMVLEASLEKHQPSAPSTPTATPQVRHSFSTSRRKETVFVPFHITYEKIPELNMLIDQVLDQKQPKTKNTSSTLSPGNGSSPASTNGNANGQPQLQRSMSALARSSSFLRPSASVAGRAANKDNGSSEKGKYGRVYIGIGDVVDVRKMADDMDGNQDELHSAVARAIQTNQHEAMVVSPVALVAAVILFGRSSGSITMGTIYEHVSWLRDELNAKGIPLDWQEHEDVEVMVAYALNLLDARQNITIDGKRVTENSNVRVIEHADNVMALSYMANQLVEMLLADALFSISYLATGSNDQVSRDELYKSFTFLIHLFKDEFIYPWSYEQKFNELLDRFISRKALVPMNEEGVYERKATHDNDPTMYTHVCLIASLLYPTLDAYWITSCSLSALRDLPYMPRKIIPVLSQWIAAHLISGRRTMYREVLSTEVSQNAVDNFLVIGFIEAVHPKTKLSPDAQILLLELGVTTNEDLVMVASQEQSQQSDNPLSKIQDLATLCHEIEKHRFGFNTQLETYRNSEVFDKCQNQIRSILRSGGKSYAASHGMNLSKDEDQMIQLVYSLKSAGSSSSESSRRNPRRVSEAYNLRSP
ncbi:hypothetical protein K492DRAFT_141202 [Lichtheimia hyalospora FSU 10163]|nr:hypothetical protein K492DRAFT_141202 [Lichtheimia hyalospora FSU 10163]